MKNKQYKIIGAILFLACAVCFPYSSATAQKKPAKPKTIEPQTVIDYLKILPVNYSKILAANPKADRLSLIKYDRRKNGFVRIGAENFWGYAEIAVFKKKSGGHLVAVNEYAQNSTCCDGGVTFYEYAKGKWKEVDPLPRFTYGDLLTAFYGKTKRQPTDEEMDEQIFALGEPLPEEITLKIAGVPVYGFRWNGENFEGGMLYLLDEN